MLNFINIIDSAYNLREPYHRTMNSTLVSCMITVIVCLNLIGDSTIVVFAKMNSA